MSMIYRIEGILDIHVIHAINQMCALQQQCSLHTLFMYIYIYTVHKYTQGRIQDFAKGGQGGRGDRFQDGHDFFRIKPEIGPISKDFKKRFVPPVSIFVYIVELFFLHSP